MEMEIAADRGKRKIGRKKGKRKGKKEKS